MLDFYYLDCSENFPEFPDENQFIGGIELKDFEMIEDLIVFSKKIGAEIFYFRDFRLKYEEIVELFNFCNHQIEIITENKKPTYFKLIEIFNSAISREADLICFSD